jgi:hypothetical protein
MYLGGRIARIGTECALDSENGTFQYQQTLTETRLLVRLP